MKIKRQGFYKEMPHGKNDDPSIFQFIQKKKNDNEEKIINLNYSRNRIWTDNSTMNLKIAPYRHNITQLTRQKGIKSL